MGNCNRHWYQNQKGKTKCPPQIFRTLAENPVYYPDSSNRNQCYANAQSDLFNSKDKIASNGIGMALTVTKVFKTIFVLEIRLGSIISHAAMIEAAAISDHDKLSEVK